MSKLKTRLENTIRAGKEPSRQKRFWPKALLPYDFQIESCNKALTRSVSYLGLDPGLGKTIVAALIFNRLNAKKPTKCFYVCPPFLLSNVDAEFSKWCFEKNLFLISDTMLSNQKNLFKINREVKNWNGRKILVIDEAHRFKNRKSNRSIQLFILAKRFKRILPMSGTPMPNSRPIELWPILRNIAPHVFGSTYKDYFRFVKRYCGAFKDERGHWNCDGFTNQKEFKEKIFSEFMIRVKKSRLNLPEKREGLLTVGDNIPPVISGLERKVLSHFTKDDLTLEKVVKISGKETLHFTEYLKLLGDYKLKYVLPYIQKILENTKDNLIIFTCHKKVLDDLELFLKNYNPCVIRGSTPSKKRKSIVDEFQKNPKRRVFLGNLVACGVGFTITKANRALFIEFSWVDGENQQAADRIHRIGQDKSVLVQYVVLKDSFDKKRMEVLLNKRAKAI